MPRRVIVGQFSGLMTLLCVLFLGGLWFFPLRAAGEGQGAGLLRLKSGREVLVGERRLDVRLSQDLYRDALEFFRQSRIDWVLESCRLLKEKGAEEVAAKAVELIEKIRRAEYSSVVVLNNGESYRGKVTAQLNPDYLGLQGQKIEPHLRTDYLGLEGQEEVPFWGLISLEADYRPALSRISGAYYLTTALEMRFRGQSKDLRRTSSQGGAESVTPPSAARAASRTAEKVKSTISKEILVRVEDPEGKARQFVLGHDYQMLKGEEQRGQVEELTRDRVKTILFYPLLGDLPSEGSESPVEERVKE